MENGNKHYTKASIEKIRHLLTRFHKIKIQRRWLFYCMKSLEDAGYIRRRKRFDKKGAGEIRQFSSMVSFTLAGARYLVTKQITGARELLQRLLKFMAGLDKRFPNEKTQGPKLTPEDLRESKRRLKAILENMV